MKKIRVSVWLVIALVLFSLILYAVQLAVFRAPGQTLFYFMQDMAFLPLQVAIVTIALKGIFAAREKRERLKKMNMAIGVFFSEAGSAMILEMMKFNLKTDVLKIKLAKISSWNPMDFQDAAKMLKGHEYDINSRASSLEALKSLVIAKRPFLLGMLENPNLLEHDSFTDMLWAVFHITDEMAAREVMNDLPETDLNHLSVDIRRAFSTLMVEWVNYMFHLKTNYPYLFSMAVRMNPFGDKMDAILR